jgi:predicted nucleic acid-binding protein
VTLIDTNVISDLIYDDPKWAAWSEESLGKALARGRLFINVVVYAELCVRTESERMLDRVLVDGSISVAPISTEVARAAALAFRAYRAQGGPKVNVLPDFFIGAHAQVEGYALLTRDATRFKTYFPTVTVLAP